MPRLSLHVFYIFARALLVGLGKSLCSVLKLQSFLILIYVPETHSFLESTVYKFESGLYQIVITGLENPWKFPN